MAITSFGPFYLPHPQAGGGAPTFNTALLIDADTERAAVYIGPAPATGDIEAVGFRTGTVTTGATVTAGVYQVSATTGLPADPPDLWAANTSGTQVIANNDDNTAFTVSLTANASVTKGDSIIAVIVSNGSGGNMTISNITGGAGARILGGGIPFCALYTTSWAGAGQVPCVWIRYSGGVYYPVYLAYPYTTLHADAFNSGSGVNQRALKFQLPHSVRVAGMWAYTLGTGGDLDYVLYDSDGTTVLESASLDADIDSGYSGAKPKQFSSTVTLSANTNYYAAIKPTSVTNVTPYEFSVTAAAVMDQLEGGQNFHYAEWNGSSWSATTTKRPFTGLIIDGVEAGSSTIGGNRHHRHLGGLSW